MTTTLRLFAPARPGTSAATSLAARMGAQSRRPLLLLLKLTRLLLAALLLSLSTLRALAAPGDLDVAFTPQVNGFVHALAVQPDGSVVLGGDFTALSGQPRHYLARVSASGTLDPGFDPNLNLGARTIVVLPTGQLLIAGLFTTVGGQSQGRMARLNADGSLDTTFAVGFVSIYAMFPQDDGRIVIAGAGPGPTQPGYLSRVTSTGASAPGFSASVNGVIYTMARQPDGKFIIGGAFTLVNGQTHKHIARLNVDGTPDPAFNADADGTVYCVAVQPDDRVLLGGAFTHLDGSSQTLLGRVNADGTRHTSFGNPLSGASGNVFSVVLQTDGKILVGGAFSFTRPYMLRLTASGAVDTTFTAAADDEVYGLTGQGDGKELVGGSFESLGGKSRSFCGRVTNDAATQSLTATSAARVQWLRGGALPEAESVSFDLSTDGGGTWTPLGAGVRIAGGWELTGLSLPVTGQIRARARTPGGYFSNSYSLLETVQAFAVPLPLAQWKLAHLGDAAAPDNGNPDGDGYANILEYATGGDPLASDVPLPSANLVPYVQLPAFETPALTLLRSTAALEATLTVQSSTDLVAWLDLARSINGATMTALRNEVTVSETGIGAQRTVEVQSGYLDSAPPRYFFRLQAVSTAAPAAPALKEQTGSGGRSRRR